MTKHPTPLEVSFENLNSSVAWAKVSEHVKETLEDEQRNFFSMEDGGTVEKDTTLGILTDLRTQRLKVKHYRELWENIQLYVLNSTRKGGNHGR